MKNNSAINRTRGSVLALATPRGFELRRVVCSYGYFLLAPNQWRPDTQTLLRPLAVGDAPVTCEVAQTSRGGPLRIACDRRLDRAEQASVKQQFARMLRLDQTLPGWTRVCPEAHRRRFGRLFRSPSLFEDMVKTITGCNVTWRNTIAMNHRLVDAVGRGVFPSPGQLARWTPSRLKQRCRVGYRAARIIGLARAFDRGEIDAAWFESLQRPAEEVYGRLLAIPGFGPYAAANVLQLLGHYDHLPIDTETYRHYCNATGTPRPARDAELNPAIEARYEPYRPYRFLAYWFELWRDYESRYGNAWTWDPTTTGANFTAAVLNRSP